jgi:hypothetical protein
MSDPQNPRDDDCELNYTKAPWIADARQVVAQLWCKPDTRHLIIEPALCEHIVQLVAGLKIEIAVAKAENFSAVLNSAESKEPLEIRLQPTLSAELDKLISENQRLKEKVREIQLSTIRTTLVKEDFDKIIAIDPESIIEQVKI